MKKQHYLFLIVGLVLLLLGSVTGLFLFNLTSLKQLPSSAEEVKMWEADPRPLQSEKDALKKVMAINKKNKDVDLTGLEMVVIPGLRGAWSINHETKKPAFGNDWVPQGLTQSNDFYYISVYDGDHQLNSLIFQVDKKTKKYVKTLILNSKAHVGGITYDNTHERLIYSDDTNESGGFGYISKEEIDNYQAEKRQQPISSERIEWRLAVRTSAITLYKNQMVVAKYGKDENDRSIISIPLDEEGLFKAITSEDIDKLAQSFVNMSEKEIEKNFISTLIAQGKISSFQKGWNRMQGITISKSGITIISQSNGLAPGKLLVQKRTPDPAKWDKENFNYDFSGPKTLDVPMAVEEVTINEEENKLGMIFESGAKKYRESKKNLFFPKYLDRILIYPLEIY